MKRYVQVVSPILLITYLLLTRYVPMNDFAAGVLAGLSIGGSLLTIVVLGRRNKKGMV